METDSRKDKYLSESNGQLSRSSRNSKLYRQVYGKYEDLDNLPLEDNTDEIDMDSLKQLLSRSEKKTRTSELIENDLEIIDTPKRDRNKQKIYDINKILEKARYENKKIREPDNRIINASKSILETLGTSDYESNYLKEKEKLKEPVLETPPSKLEMTREMKYHTKNISENPLINQVMPDNDLSLELLSDLKPSGNTIVTKPITEKEEKNNITKTKEFTTKNKTINTKEVGFFPMDPTDTSDIDIIKNDKEIDKDFFTSSYEFSRKDFTDYDDDDTQSNNFLKVFLLIFAICIFVAVIVYFVINYGINK